MKSYGSYQPSISQGAAGLISLASVTYDLSHEHPDGIISKENKTLKK